MAHIVAFNQGITDFESAVEEIDFLIPKYLEEAQKLKILEDIEEVSPVLRNVAIYWERLERLFEEVKPFDKEIPFNSIINNARQAELQALEALYLKLNLKIEFQKDEWSDLLWTAAKKVLNRMDSLLAGMGFDKSHKDRRFIEEIQQNNHLKGEKIAS